MTIFNYLKRRLFLFSALLIVVSFFVEVKLLAAMVGIFFVSLLLYKPYLFKRFKNILLWLFIVMTIILFPLTNSVTPYSIFGYFYIDPELFVASLKMSIRILLLLNAMSLMNDSFREQDISSLWNKFGIQNYKVFSDEIDKVMPQVSNKAKSIIKEIKFKELHKFSFIDLISKSLAELLFYNSNPEEKS